MLEHDIKKEYYLEQVNSHELAAEEKLRFVDSLQLIMNIHSAEFLRLKARVLEEAGLYESAAKFYKGVFDIGDADIVIRTEALYNCIILEKLIGDYHGSLDNIITLITMQKPDTLDYYDVEAYLVISQIYLLLGNTGKSFKYLDKIPQLLETLSLSQEEKASYIASLHAVKAANYLQSGKYADALKEDSIALAHHPDSLTLEVIYCNKAILYEHIGQFDKAEKCFSVLANPRSININRAYNLFNYSQFLYNRARYRESLDLCLSILPYMKSTGAKHVRGCVYEVMAKNYRALGEDSEAYEALMLSKNTLDSVRASSYQLSSDVTADFERKMQSLNDSIKHRYYDRMFWVTIALVLLILGLCVFAWRLKTRLRRCLHDFHNSSINFNAERQLRIKEVDDLEATLDSSNKELLALASRVTGFDSIVDKVNAIVDTRQLNLTETRKAIKDLLKGFDKEEDNWSRIKFKFDKAYPGYLQMLCKRHSDLTQGEIKMCISILLNLSGKETAEILCRTVRTVETAKYRLHKKLGLGPEISTATYLRQLMTDSMR